MWEYGLTQAACTDASTLAAVGGKARGIPIAGRCCVHERLEPFQYLVDLLSAPSSLT